LTIPHCREGGVFGRNPKLTGPQTLITDAGSSWPSTSVFEINSYAGVPLDKIVIGKPLDSGAASNG
jgi:hypothetical protein